MTLEDFLNLTSEESNVCLVFEDGDTVLAKARTLQAIIDVDIMTNQKVCDIEARDSVLWARTKDKDTKGD